MFWTGRAEPERWTCAHCGRGHMVLAVAACVDCGEPREAPAVAEAQPLPRQRVRTRKGVPV